MIARNIFIERTLILIKKQLEENLIDKGTLEEMIEKRNKILNKLIKGE